MDTSTISTVLSVIVAAAAAGSFVVDVVSVRILLRRG
jgi:hypothetical protein